MVKNPPANVGDAFDPWSGKIPQAMEQPSLSPTATARVLHLLKPAHLEPMLHKRSHHNEKAAHHTPLTTRSPCSNKDPTQPKIGNFFLIT